MNEWLIAEKVAARGLQVNRKDKDLMSDTGGTSKGRDKKTPMKPPREDLKNRYRTKDKPSEEREKDIDRNHDKDTKASFNPFLGLPEPTYGDKVANALVDILSEERGISEKAFSLVNELINEAKRTVSERLELVEECEREGARPELCAEILYGVIVANSPSSQFFDIRASFRDSMVMAKRELARFPDTFMRLLGRVG